MHYPTPETPPGEDVLRRLAEIAADATQPAPVRAYAGACLDECARQAAVALVDIAGHLQRWRRAA